MKMLTEEKYAQLQPRSKASRGELTVLILERIFGQY